ncbi:uncharacterized protein LOC124165956 [Ischnura elegans]|uniref:uncharacterized protein LOC124165956 n=1 Tax=Ischnura elegans TaxID=197161 RepID=UPI001ED8B12C|nr:uncharacterized protein LOC124165956 [Ischnura elegans]
MALNIAVLFALFCIAAAAKESSPNFQLSALPAEGKSLLEVFANGGSLPSANDYEVIRRAPDGSLHVVQSDEKNPALPPPGATVVLLEEKPGGGYEVRGVQSSAPVDQLQGLLENIQEGSLALPSPEQSNRIFLPPMPTGIPQGPTTPLPYTPVVPGEPQSLPPTPPPTTPRPQPQRVPQPTARPRRPESYSASTTRQPPLRKAATIRLRPAPANSPPPPPPPPPPPAPATTPAPYYSEEPAPQPVVAPRHRFSSNRRPQAPRRRPAEEYAEEAEESAIMAIMPEASESLRTSLTEVLRRDGYKEMARLVEKAGLEDMLAKTGPYTIFAPTDTAFKELMEQLGGTKRAEAKFKENPRLLSGLMLHHVIPGSFKVNTLQDEMTGVSLAGTQLRVNIYEPKTVVINGARIQRPDIWVPGGGVAHAIDRVLFPLPVGDLLHTLIADPRYSIFLKVIHAADLEDVLTGKRTYTLFAPTDKAFESFSVGEMNKLLKDRAKSRGIVARHLVPGALYTSGIRDFQVKYTMQQGVTIKLHSEAGHLKINSSHVVLQNIPATNGVVHAIDTLI